eukprot:TRINITY_DN11654_c0_g1_i1.p1 TRINITY_DN11654_c0_g1~~TRINITY_DN11654_c0_g1_i1.p1  ORF type:complete len:453 (-),score=172.03 TRINITY_DN11654_c0_g1_i1:549-1841(-)
MPNIQLLSGNKLHTKTTLRILAQKTDVKILFEKIQQNKVCESQKRIIELKKEISTLKLNKERFLLINERTRVINFLDNARIKLEMNETEIDEGSLIAEQEKMKLTPELNERNHIELKRIEKQIQVVEEYVEITNEFQNISKELELLESEEIIAENLNSILIEMERNKKNSKEINEFKSILIEQKLNIKKSSKNGKIANEIKEFGIIKEIEQELKKIILNKGKFERDLHRLGSIYELNHKEEQLLAEQSELNCDFEKLNLQIEEIYSIINANENIDGFLANIMNNATILANEIIQEVFPTMCLNFKLIQVNQNNNDEQNPDKSTSTTGIELVCHLNNVKVNLNRLSGGQKTIVGLSIFIALLIETKPPLILLDEIDADLDEENQKIMKKLLKKYLHQAKFQCFEISHRLNDNAGYVQIPLFNSIQGTKLDL